MNSNYLDVNIKTFLWMFKKDKRERP